MLVVATGGYRTKICRWALALAAGALFDSSGARAAFTYENLTELIASEKIRSVEELLPQLPQDLRSNYALMRATRSLQHADPLHPRAILFGVDASLTCTFSGVRHRAGFDLLECIQFRKKERAFDFRQIVFPMAENGLVEPAFSERNVTVNGEIHCTSCHGRDPKPLWDSYRFWPGAYGESDDDLGPQRPEYAKYVALRAEDPRYK